MILDPKQSWSIIPAQQLSGLQEQRVLIVGQMLAAGTATAGDLLQDISDDTSANNALFGRTSHLAGLIRQFKALNEITQLDVIPLDDAGAATAGTAIFTITGTATEDGTLNFTIGSDQNHKFEVDVTSGDTAEAVGDALVALTDLDLDAPSTAANAAGVVTATAENKGTMSDNWAIKVDGTVAGIAVALTGWTGGATDPTLTSVLDVIADIRYRTIVWPSVYALTTIETELNSRFNQQYMVMDGIAIQVIPDTLANLKTYANQNSQSVTVLGNKAVSETDRIGAATMEMPDIIAAEHAAFRALKFETGAPLTQFVTTVAPADQFGGIGSASLPYHNTLYPNLSVEDARDGFSVEDQVELTGNGVAVFGANRAFNSTIMGTQVTTYLTNGAGNPDTSYKFVETVDTASVIREYFFENFRARYAQTRLTDGDLVAGRDMANEGSIRAFSMELYGELADDVLVQKGSVALKDFNDNLAISISTSTGVAIWTGAPLLVTQLRVVLGTIAIKFSS